MHVEARAERTIVVDGESRSRGRIKSRLSAGEPGEMLEAAYRQTAAYRWRGEGIDRTCSVDLEFTYNSAARRYSIVGQMCGRDVQITLPVVLN
jgi:hypothetical protein